MGVCGTKDNNNQSVVPSQHRQTESKSAVNASNYQEALRTISVDMVKGLCSTVDRMKEEFTALAKKHGDAITLLDVMCTSHFVKYYLTVLKMDTRFTIANSTTLNVVMDVFSSVGTTPFKDGITDEQAVNGIKIASTNTVAEINAFIVTAQAMGKKSLAEELSFFAKSLSIFKNVTTDAQVFWSNIASLTQNKPKQPQQQPQPQQ